MMKQSEILLTGKTRNTTNLRNSGPVALENGSMKAKVLASLPLTMEARTCLPTSG